MGNSTRAAASIFSGFLDFGEAAIGGIDKRDKPAVRYKLVLGEVTELLKATHGLVMDRLDAIMEARSLEAANQLIDELDAKALEDTFRSQGMCELFQAFGDALGNLTRKTMNAPSRFTPEQLQEIQAFAAMLADRETEVARRYELEIVELGDLVRGTRTDLDMIRQRAERARRVLTDQLADFDAQSQRFRQLIKA